MILGHSEKNIICLSEELVALRLKLDIEKRRFGDNFRFFIMLDEQIETEILHIPPMLLHSFVENAAILLMITKNPQRIQVSQQLKTITH